MWFYQFCSLILLCLALSMNFNFVENHGPSYNNQVYNKSFVLVNSKMNNLDFKIIHEPNGLKLKLLVAVVTFKKKDAIARKGLSILDTRESETNIDNITANILRDAYGEACIKVAIRKCYKALLAVNANVCKRRYKCESKFRSYLKTKSKEGCIKEFDYSKRINNKKKSTMKSKRDKFNYRTFVDATREGYLDACIPYLIPNNKAVLRDNAPVIAFANEMLRDKSDKKCQKLSRAKCFRACSFASKKTCSKYYCRNRRRKAFNKVCKEECRRHYQIHNRAANSSESSSDSG